MENNLAQTGLAAINAKRLCNLIVAVHDQCCDDQRSFSEALLADLDADHVPYFTVHRLRYDPTSQIVLYRNDATSVRKILRCILRGQKTARVHYVYCAENVRNGLIGALGELSMLGIHVLPIALKSDGFGSNHVVITKSERDRIKHALCRRDYAATPCVIWLPANSITECALSLDDCLDFLTSIFRSISDNLIVGDTITLAYEPFQDSICSHHKEFAFTAESQPDEIAKQMMAEIGYTLPEESEPAEVNH